METTSTKRTSAESVSSRRLLSASDPESSALQERALAAVMNVRGRFAALESQLQEARFQIARLEYQLQRERARIQDIHELSTATLRRRVAYHLHPDRGGDAETMTQINALFDVIEKVQDDVNLDIAA